MIAIIDYKAGNSTSVENACKKMNIESRLVSDSAGLESASGIILPGVGSAKATMDSLSELGIVDKLSELVLDKKVPFLGICVGLQVLFEHSEEDDTDCLGWFKGQVKQFDKSKVRVPQIGWNRVDWKQSNAVNKGSKSGNYFYFVNSYYVVPEDDGIIMAVTNYNGEFVSMVSSGNIYASQFHIEKSGTAGLQLLKNFADLGEK